MCRLWGTAVHHNPNACWPLLVLTGTYMLTSRARQQPTEMQSSRATLSQLGCCVLVTVTIAVHQPLRSANWASRVMASHSSRMMSLNLLLQGQCRTQGRVSCSSEDRMPPSAAVAGTWVGIHIALAHWPPSRSIDAHKPAAPCLARLLPCCLLCKSPKGGCCVMACTRQLHLLPTQAHILLSNPR